MKYLKTFESRNEPQIDDYVICGYNDMYNAGVNKDIENQIGKLEGILRNHPTPYVVKFSIPSSNYSSLKGVTGGTQLFKREQILAYGKTIEEVKLNLMANKYNL